jgi:hypothetical protein
LNIITEKVTAEVSSKLDEKLEAFSWEIQISHFKW